MRKNSSMRGLNTFENSTYRVPQKSQEKVNCYKSKTMMVIQNFLSPEFREISKVLSDK